MKSRVIVKVGIFSAIAFVLQLLGNLFPKVGGFLDVEFSDLPAIMLSFAEGPLVGVLVELIKNVLHLTITGTGAIGELANFCVNGVFVFVAGYIYKQNKTKKTAIIALGAAIVLYTITACIFNYYILLPAYIKGINAAGKLDLLKIISAFNIVKGVVLSVITLLLYKKLAFILKRNG